MFLEGHFCRHRTSCSNKSKANCCCWFKMDFGDNFAYKTYKNNKKNSNKENKLPMLRKPLEQECSDRVKKMEPVRLKQA